MKKKKIKLHFDKKVISNLTKIRGGQEIGVGTLSNAPDAQSICLCGPTTAPSNNCPEPPEPLSTGPFCIHISQRRDC